jgi:hypothetical protein
MELLKKFKLVDAFLILAAIMIVLWPEADPSWLKPATDIHDAAWWADPAKQKILHGSWMNGPFAGALAVGPLSVILHFLSFKVFGIGFVSLRLMSIIPAILMGFWIRIYVKELDGSRASILLLSSTACFTLARLGLPEIWMGFLLLMSIFTIQKGTVKSSVLAGVLLFLAFLIKASFLYQIFIILPLLYELFKKGNNRSVFAFATSFIILIAIYYFLYLSKYQELFIPFFQEFSADYFSFQQLINPVGLFARVVFLTDREFFKDPSVVMMILALLIKTAAGFTPSKRINFSALFFIGIIFLLPSDFAGRRFIPLLPLLVLALIEPRSEKHLPIYLQVLLVFILNWISFGILLPSNSLFVYSDGIFEIQPLTYFIGIVQVILFALLKFKFNSSLYSIQYFKYSVGVLSLAWISLLLRNYLMEPMWIITICSFGIVLILHVLNLSNQNNKIQLGFLVLMGLIVNGFSLFNLSFTERDHAISFAKSINDSSCHIAGNSTAFSITLLSESSAMHYPLSPTWKNVSPCAVVGYATVDDDSASLEQKFHQIEMHYFNEKVLQCTNIQVWKPRLYGMICFPRREN